MMLRFFLSVALTATVSPGLAEDWTLKSPRPEIAVEGSIESDGV